MEKYLSTVVGCLLLLMGKSSKHRLACNSRVVSVVARHCEANLTHKVSVLNSGPFYDLQMKTRLNWLVVLFVEEY